MEIKELTTGDVLKKEASQKTRKYLKATGDEKCGKSFILDQDLNASFLCLSNPENGKVLIQPADCTISLKGFKNLAELSIAAGVEIANANAVQTALKGADFGIIYIDIPKSEE